jgi:glucokinase
MIAAVDIGGTKMAVGLVDSQGKVWVHRECPTDRWGSYQNALQEIIRMLNEIIAEIGERPEGIGIGCTGPVHPESGALGKIDFLPDWEGANLAGDLSRAFGLPVGLENDADAAALGEAAWGTGKDARRFILLTVGTGIGGGLVFDSKLYRGLDGVHPEIGHHVIDPAGPACFCGAHGCWESLAGGLSFAAWMQNQLPAGYPGIENLTAERICQLATQGDSLAQQAVGREATYLGIGLANIITLFAPDLIALGGSVMKSWPLFATEARRVIAQNCGLVPYEKVRIVQASLGPDTGLAGAAQVWVHKYQ